METTAKSNSRVERYSFTSAALAVGGVVLLIGMAPRNERALFLRDRLGQAKAFAAVVPPLDAVRAQLERGAMNDIAWRTAQSDAGRLNRGGRRSASSGTELIPGTVPALLTNGPTGASNANDAGIGGTGNPTPGNAATPSGVAPPPTGGGAPSGGGGGGVPPASVAPPAPGAPGLTVLPEPASWAMMLIGFLAIGAMIRRPAGRRAGLNA